MTDRALNQPFEVPGEWYLPTEPGRLIPGTLHYAQKNTELHLLSAFRPFQGTVRAGDAVETYPVIHGISQKGEAMTLLDAWRIGMSINFGSGGLRQPENLISSCLVIGGHLPAHGEFAEMSFRIPGLQVWMCREAIHISTEVDEGTRVQELSYRVQCPPTESVRVPAINGAMEWRYAFNANMDPYSSIDVNVSAWITIKPDAAKQLDWYLEQSHVLTTMLTFLAGVPMSPDCIRARTGENSDLSLMVALRDQCYCDFKSPHEFFVTRSTMSSRLEDVVNRWFDVYARIRMPSSLAISIFASEKLWLHVEFLSLMQALEGLHRSLFEGSYMDEADYKEVCMNLTNAIPTKVVSDHRDALRARIKYGNQLSLRRRLDDLAMRLDQEIRTWILGGTGTVPGKWVDTRNYYTHWDEALRPNVLDGQAMYNACVRMRHLLRALYLDQMGIPQESIFKSLSNTSSTSQHLIQINAVDRRQSDPADTSGVILTITNKEASDSSN